METFDDIKLKKQLHRAIDDLGFEVPTPIQQESFAPIMAGRDFVGIAQTGTGKTMAYLLPILQDLSYSEQLNPRVIILAPTRELVLQIVEEIEKLSSYFTVRVLGVFGGSNNIKSQKIAVSQGQDIIIGTPRRLYDLAIANVLRFKSVKKLVIDEVDIMLDFGYKTQLKNIFEKLPRKRQHILFSATMTEYVSELIKDFLINPVSKTISLSGTPLDTISQVCYPVHNFYTKVNLVNHLLQDQETFSKVLIFVGTKTNADRLFDKITFHSDTCLIHAGKEQNYRTKSIESFESGDRRILVATDVIARGIDLEKVSHVISFNTPFYPENYIHRIGRTGRAGEQGHSILLYTPKEVGSKEAIEDLMKYTIPTLPFPDEVVLSHQLTPEEKDQPVLEEVKTKIKVEGGGAFHEKLAKNNKEKTERISYEKQLKERYKKPLRKGDKIQNMKKKKKH